MPSARFHLSLSALLLGACAAASRAQTLPATFNLAPTLTALEHDTPAQTAARLQALPPSALNALYEALDQNTLSPAARTAITTSLPGIVSHNLTLRLDADRRADNDWNRRTGIDAYKASSSHNPVWDKIVLDAFDHNPADNAGAFQKFKAAVDAGCNDPLVRYYYVKRGYLGNALPHDRALDLMTADVEDLDASAYSPGRKFFAHLFLTDLLLSGDAPRVDLAKPHLEKCLDLLPQLPAEHPSLDSMRINIPPFYAHLHQAGIDRKESFDKIEAMLLAVFPDRFLPHSFAATFYLDWAWDARGGGYASTVTPEGAKLFEERAQLGEAQALQSVALDPTDSIACDEMLRVCLAKGYPRPVMEKWYHRAMLAYPDNRDACNIKMLYLQPRWYGTPAELLAFGRDCVNNGTAYNRIPLFLVAAHESLAETAQDRDAYFTHPAVWADIRSAYEKLLADKTRLTRYPAGYLEDRAKYLHYAVLCKQWQEFLTLQKDFGENIDLKTFGGQTLLNFYKKKAAEEIAKRPI